MKLRVISVLLIFQIFLSNVAFSQTSTSTTGEFTFLKKGEEAPFDGVLFDNLATSNMLADKKYQRDKCKVEVKYEKDILKAACARDTKYLRYQLDIEKNKSKLIYDVQQEEIESLRKLAKGSNTTLWTAIGFFLGAGTSIAIFYAATEIAK